jgi:hypothetical protein
MNIQEIGLIVALAITTIGAIFTVYDRFSKPDVKNSTDIGLLQAGCKFRHSAIDQDIAEIKQSQLLMKENHLPHIEAAVNRIDKTQTKILTILEAKYQIKIDE